MSCNRSPCGRKETLGPVQKAKHSVPLAIQLPRPPIFGRCHPPVRNATVAPRGKPDFRASLVVMFIFARRALQADLDRLSTSLPPRPGEAPGRTAEHARDRSNCRYVGNRPPGGNRPLRGSHPRGPLPNGRRPDIAAILDGGVSVVGDINDLSDVGLRELNPVDFLAARSPTPPPPPSALVPHHPPPCMRTPLTLARFARAQMGGKHWLF
jgi:hypothetical protein